MMSSLCGYSIQFKTSCFNFFSDNGYYLYGEVMPVIPPHTSKKDKKLLPMNSEDVVIGDENNSDSKTIVAQTDSSIWW